MVYIFTNLISNIWVFLFISLEERAIMKENIEQLSQQKNQLEKVGFKWRW